MTPEDLAPRPSRLGARLGAGVLLIVGLAFVQQPGRLVADTKFDLVVDPWGFLARAGHLWDGAAAFGQLQNQAYGYLWPMGPFFGVLTSAGLDAWVVQRLWIALVMAAAFVGAALLVRALGVRSDLACLAAAAAYALSPRILSIVGGISIEAWPSAVAPWVLLPLVVGSRRGSPRRAAAWSALAVGMVGGVNAAATSAVLPLGAIWLLTREPGRRRRTMMTWWPVFTFLATAWWLVPLFLLGAYSPPFLDWIESASVTTFPTNPFDALRGTSAWIPYVEPGWQAGNDLLRQSHLVLNSVVLLLAGLLGLLVRRNPERLFLALSLSVGLLLVSLGHVGEVAGWFGADLRPLLDGALAPLRNVHKFDPVVRLPLVVGLAWTLEALLAARARSANREDGAPPWAVRSRTTVAVGAVLLAVLATASPALLGRLAPTGSTTEVPDYWRETATWLGERDDAGTALLLPGSSFGSYVWGEPRDEPLQSLSTSSWAVRNAVPLAPAGNIRMLDAVEERLTQGRGSAGLAPYLARAGVSHLVVRNDLTRSNDIPDPVLVHRALDDSPGLRRVATFGPEVGGDPLAPVDDRRVLVQGGWQEPYPAVEIFEVTGEEDRTTAAPATVVGGPEDLLDLLDHELIAAEPTVLAPDADPRTPPDGPLVLTDGLRDRERSFGRIHDAVSPVRLPGARSTSGNPTRDYLLDDAERWSTRAVARGDVTVTSSSSVADAGTPGGARRGFLDYAATDLDPDTAFRSSPTDADPWWRISLTEPRVLEEVDLLGGREASVDQRVTVRTDVGTIGTYALGPGERRPVPLPSQPLRWLELSATGTGLDIAEARVDGVDAERWWATPELPPTWGAPDTIVLRTDTDRRTGCLTVSDEVRCSPEQPSYASEEPGALRRVVSLPEPASYPLEMSVRADQRATELVLAGKLGRIEASSREYLDLRASAVAAVDGDVATTWIAAAVDERPDLSFSWLRPRTVRGISLQLDPSTPASRVTRVRLTSQDGSRTARLDADGRADFRPLRTSAVQVELRGSDEAVSLGFDGRATSLPVGVTEARLRGVREFPLEVGGLRRSFPCGSGPVLVVNGRETETRVRASDAEILQGLDVPARPCGRRLVDLAAGSNLVEARVGAAGFLPSTVVLGDTAEARATESTTEVSSGTTVRTISGVEPGQVVALAENANPGWEATQDGRRLQALTVDGWRGAWRATGSGPVTVEFTPDPAYRLALLAGAGLFLVLVLALWRGRRWSGDAPALSARRLPPYVGPVLGVVVAGLVAGWPGAAGALLLGTVLRVGVASWSVAQALCLLPLLLAGAHHVARPWGSADGWAGLSAWSGYLVAAAVAGVWFGVARDSAVRRRPRAGFSTRT